MHGRLFVHVYYQSSVFAWPGLALGPQVSAGITFLDRVIVVSSADTNASCPLGFLVHYMIAKEQCSRNANLCWGENPMPACHLQHKLLASLVSMPAPLLFPIPLCL
jgi:hypothetical protein